MKPWRENVYPHRDVREGNFQQSEFAADMTAVRKGSASPEYRDPVAFFERTFITEGMRLLLTQVAQRLCGQGGEPVIQLQTAFGGGKTHTMLAVYHLASRECALSELSGIPSLLDRARLLDVPKAKVAVLDGTAHAPGQAWKHERTTVKTLWGELAWQLGASEGYERVRQADETGTSPGKEVLRDLLAAYAPCVVLIDELVAYVRQFVEGQALSGGTYDSNMSFIQALTEAVKLVPNAVVLASLPESEIEAGSQRGVSVLRALEKTFGRVQALWKPVAAEEAFEIVRRRLFEPIRDVGERDAVCRAFADAYVAEGERLPSETQEGRYFDRLVQAYPIHPEIFDRLYEDWTTIDGFQRTRGVLKLMAKVIYRLWTDQNRDLLIMPGALPLDDSNTRNELVYHLAPGWDAVIDSDIDGEQAETTELEKREPRFGQVSAARSVARTLFLGSAPASVVQHAGIRGIDRGRVLLGCLQPRQASSVYADALNRLSDRLHYLNASGDKDLDSTRFWFDTRANLRREMEDRKRRFDERTEVVGKIATTLQRLVGAVTYFDGVHVFTPHGDVPDDSALRLVVLSYDKWYTRDESRQACDAVREWVRNNGTKPRHRWNRLLFLAAEHSTLPRLIDAARVALAWGSIVRDVKEDRLNIDQIQRRQAERELLSAEEVLPRAARECYKWLLCPAQEAPTETEFSVEAFTLNTSAVSIGRELERVCDENELVISTWSPIHLRARLRDLYWTVENPACPATTFWEDSLRYLYLPRLKSRDALIQTIQTGASSRDFFGTAYGRIDGRYEGFQFGAGRVQFDHSLLLIEPAAASAYEQSSSVAQPAAAPGAATTLIPSGLTPKPVATAASGTDVSPRVVEPISRSFHASAEIPPATAKMRLVQVAEEIIANLIADPHANVRVTIEISAEFPSGVGESTKRTVSENARALGLKYTEWD